MRLYGRIEGYTKNLREDLHARDGIIQRVVTQKGRTRFKYSKGVPRDEERRGKIYAEVSHMSTC